MVTEAAEKKGRVVKFKPVKIPVKFGSFSADDRTVSIGIVVQLDSVDDDPVVAVSSLFRWICTRHIKAELILGRRDEGETQGKFFETDTRLTAEFDTNTNGTSIKRISNRLSVDETAIDCEALRKFAKREGFLRVLSVMETIDADAMEAERAADAERPLLDDDEESDDEAGNPEAPKAAKRQKAKAK